LEGGLLAARLEDEGRSTDRKVGGWWLGGGVLTAKGSSLSQEYWPMAAGGRNLGRLVAGCRNYDRKEGSFSDEYLQKGWQLEGGY
jgi:hypothetical protein